LNQPIFANIGIKAGRSIAYRSAVDECKDCSLSYKWTTKERRYTHVDI